MAGQFATSAVNVLLVTAQAHTHAAVQAALAGPASPYRLFWVAEPELALVRAQDVQPGVVLLDLDPGSSISVDFVGALAGSVPEAAVVVLVGASDLPLARRAVLAGAQGFATTPVEREDLRATLRQVAARARSGARRAPSGADVPAGQLIVFCAPKGGTGRTTMATNIAISLRQTAKASVVLIDADYAAPAIDVALNMRADHSIADLLPKMGQLDRDLIAGVVEAHSSGVQVLHAPPSGQSEQRISRLQVQELCLWLKRMFTWVIVDLGLPIDETGFAFLDAADLVVMSVLPEMVGLRNARRMLDQLSARGYPDGKLWPVVNRDGLPSGIPVPEVENWLGTRTRFRIPNDQELATETINSGVPSVIGHRRSALARAYRNLAAELERAVVTPWAYSPDGVTPWAYSPDGATPAEAAAASGAVATEAAAGAVATPWAYSPDGATPWAYSPDGATAPGTGEGAGMPAGAPKARPVAGRPATRRPVVVWEFVFDRLGKVALVCALAALVFLAVGTTYQLTRPRTATSVPGAPPTALSAAEVALNETPHLTPEVVAIVDLQAQPTLLGSRALSVTSTLMPPETSPTATATASAAPIDTVHFPAATPMPTRTPRPTHTPRPSPAPATPWAYSPDGATPWAYSPDGATPTPSPSPIDTVHFPAATETSTSTPRPPSPTPRRLLPTARPSPTAAPVSAPALVAPAPGDVRGGEVTFSWQPTGLLPPGAAYEVVWWNKGEDPSAARGFAPPTTGSSLTTNLDVLYGTGLIHGPDLYWTVLVVNTSPYRRLTAPNATNAGLLVYGPASTGDDGGGGAPPPPPPKP